MATVSFIPESRQSISAMKAVIDYCLQQKKVADEDSGRRLVSGVNCNGENAFTEFMATKTAHHKKGGMNFYHYVQSFSPSESVTAEQVHQAISRVSDAEGRLRSAEKELSKMVSHAQMMENRYKDVRNKAAKARDEYNKLKVGYDKEFEKQTAHLEELKQARQEAAEGIDPAYMERYKAIRSQRFPVMARIHNDQCSGCNMSLPSAVAKQITGSDEIVECENCGRILYIPDGEKG